MVNCHGSRVPHSRASNSINQIQSTRLFPLLIPLLPFVRRVPTVLRDTSPRYSDLQLWVKAGSNANSLPPAGSPSMFFSTVHISPCLPTAGTVRSVRPHFHQLILIFSPKATNLKLAGLNTLKYSVWTSRGAGLVLAFDGGLILLPMLRNIIRVIRPKLAWLFPADENIWFHRQVAYSMAFWAMVHTTAHYVNFINVERTRKPTWYHVVHNCLIFPRNSQADRPPDPLHPAGWHHRPLYALDHGYNVLYCPQEDQKPML